MKKWIAACLLVFALIVSGCGGKNDVPAAGKEATSPEEVAKVAIQAFIDGDAKMLESTMRENTEGVNEALAQLLIDKHGPTFADMKIEDFTLEQAQMWGKDAVRVNKDGQKVMFLYIEKIGDHYYFTGDK